MHDFEKLGVFYLGREYDLAARALSATPLLYDSKDLTTHAVCVGMTGSGKTGLCLSLLEEAAIDGVPAICIDPKGDLGNLLLTFPELRSEDFAPWVDPSAAARADCTVEQFADQTASTWRKGLSEWGQDGERIRRFRDAVDLSIYTPGSSAGLPLAVLRSFAAPPAEIRDDEELLRERVTSAVSGLLALAGIKADPVQSREHVLLSTLLERAWRAGVDLELADLIRQTQQPPIERVGVLEMQSFYPEKDRQALLMRLNNLLASPSFSTWLEGDPLEVGRLLFTPEGQPRLTILSIAHLSEAERMFFVTLLLNEVLAWVRMQAGTSSLRAILYMDEVFGYFPPTANPPAKRPMLSLLKQARAYGLGVVLATQNPVDLDYKGLSNAGTWFLGRLQTERDKQRVLEGLEGAAAHSGSGFDRQAMEATLAALGSRVFLMNNVHEHEPVVFQTRWALSYLRGPLTRGQIATLMSQRKEAESEVEAASSDELVVSTKALGDVSPTMDEVRPELPERVVQRFFPIAEDRASDSPVRYLPAVVGSSRLHFVRKGLKIDVWKDYCLLAGVDAETAEPKKNQADGLWKQSQALAAGSVSWEEQPTVEAQFASLPEWMANASAYERLRRRLVEHLYREERLFVYRSKRWKLISDGSETQREFVARLRQTAREQRDARMEDVDAEFAKRLERLDERLARAEKRVAEEASQYHESAFDTVLSVGGSLLEALLGRKKVSVTNARRATSSVRKVRRSMDQRDDVTEAQRKLDSLRGEKQAVEQAFEAERAKITDDCRVSEDDVETYELPPLKKDIEAAQPLVVWLPWFVDEDGSLRPGFRLPHDAPGEVEPAAALESR